MDGRRIVCVGLGEKEILVTSCEISEMRRANLQEAKLRSDKSRLANLCESNPLKESICARCLIRSRRELHHAPRRAAPRCYSDMTYQVHSAARMPEPFLPRL